LPHSMEESIWKVRAPLKVTFYTWIAMLGKILMTDNLRKMGGYNCGLVLYV